MGVDAMVYARGKITPDKMDELDARAYDIHFEEYTDDGNDWVVWQNTPRYYGEGYERGPWLEIVCAIETLRATYGHVYYHGDHTWYGEVPVHTIKDTAELWALWHGEHWDDYHNRPTG